MPKTRRLLVLVTVIAGCSFVPLAAALNIDRLDETTQQILHTTLEALAPLIAERKQAGTAGLLTWEELHQPLTIEQRALLDEMRQLRGGALGATAHYFGERMADIDLVRIDAQRLAQNGRTTPIDSQYLPRTVFRAYTHMMDAMKADLGRGLLVESGYRSPAYQLYLFLFFLPTHDYSIRETNRFVALPGHSEHGHPARQAIDFINENGINGEEHPEEFEALPEYAWLQQHADRFGFSLSYPRDNPHNTAFEPWHWHYTGNE